MSDLAIELKGVSKTYADFALRDVDLALEPGQIMGFVGPNGAGKSTTIRIIMGLIHQDRGECRVLGRPMPVDQIAAKRDIGFVSEDMRLYKQATFDWHMRFVASIFPGWDEAYARSLVDRFELRPQQRLRRFSHGERVKAMLLLALARRPKLLVLDEPTTGLDPVARHEVLAELMEVLREEDRTILFSTHNTQDVEQISDQITFIDRGRIVASRDKESFLERWRRIRLELPAGSGLPELAGVVDVSRDGSIALVTCNDYRHAIDAQLTEAGARIASVDAMTLEEIFIASVQHGRKEAR